MMIIPINFSRKNSHYSLNRNALNLQISVILKTYDLLNEVWTCFAMKIFSVLL